MLTHWDDIACTRLDEEINPRTGIEPLGLEERNEILIAEVCLRAVRSDVMFEGLIPRNIHVARVPLVSECRNRVHTPVNENAELGVAKPLGCPVLGEGIPVAVKADASICGCGLSADFGQLARRIGSRVQACIKGLGR
jgi:hypothetical protein